MVSAPFSSQCIQGLGKGTAQRGNRHLVTDCQAEMMKWDAEYHSMKEHQFEKQRKSVSFQAEKILLSANSTLNIWASFWENRIFAYAKTKMQISCAVTAQLISAFVFATWIIQSLYFLNPKFRASSHLQWLPSLVCVSPGQKPRRPVFSERGSYSDENYQPASTGQ